jgi:hypothetical protein
MLPKGHWMEQAWTDHNVDKNNNKRQGIHKIKIAIQNVIPSEKGSDLPLKEHTQQRLTKLNKIYWYG